MEKESGDTKSSDSEVKVPVKKRRMPVSDESDDDKFEIQFESKAGGNDRGDSAVRMKLVAVWMVEVKGSSSMSLISTTILRKMC